MTNHEQFPEPELSPFDALMDAAQKLHNVGEFKDAQDHWQQAEDIAPDPIEKARAIRGDAASAHQQGKENYALERAKTAHSIHDTCVDALSVARGTEYTRALRERGQSAGVLGRIGLRGVAQQELAGKATTVEARHSAQRSVCYLDTALHDIKEVERRTGIPDQYRINTLSHVAIGNALYGDKCLATQAAREARQISWRSESGPTSSHYSLGHRARAVIRAYTATAVQKLATVTDGNPRRRLALKLATSKAGL